MNDLARILIGRCNPQWGYAEPRRKNPDCCVRCGIPRTPENFYTTSRPRKDGTLPLKSICKRCEVRRVVERRRA
jgi:hypothetical protein